MSKRLPTTPRSRVKNGIRQTWLRSRERAAALKATGHCCARCGIKASQAKGKEVKLQVHHIGGINWDGVVDLIFERVLNVPQEPLCLTCHAKEHGRKEMRTLEAWMTFTQREVDLLSEEAWQSYKERRCLCAAREPGDCFCGAWDNVEKETK